jgi:hypothetical protein
MVKMLLMLCKAFNVLMNRYNDSRNHYNDSLGHIDFSKIKTLLTFCKAFNTLMNRITIQEIVITILYSRTLMSFCKGYSSSLVCTLLTLGGSQCTDRFRVTLYTKLDSELLAGLILGQTY